MFLYRTIPLPNGGAIDHIALALVLGCALGLISGLVPGIHVNTLAAMLVSLSLVLTIPFNALAIVVLCAAVVHSFVSIVPSILLGAPNPDTALAVLPAHRLVLDGRGLEALRLSALGSFGASLLSISLVPVFVLFLLAGYPFLSRHMGVLLVGVMVVMVLSEKPSHGSTHVARAKAAGILVLSGMLGMLALHGGERMYVGGGDVVLMPLFTGLFGAPLLIECALAPPPTHTILQSKKMKGLPKGRTLRSIVGGVLAGGAVSWMPGVSASVGTLLVRVLFLRREVERADDDARELIVSLSGVNTSDVVFSLFALYILHRARSGAMAAIDELFPPHMWSSAYLVLLLLAVAIASLVGYVGTIWLGGFVLNQLFRIEVRTLVVGVLVLLLILTAVLSGAFGTAVFFSAVSVGLLCGRLGVRRSNAMGVLLIPAALYFLL